MWAAYIGITLSFLIAGILSGISNYTVPSIVAMGPDCHWVNGAKLFVSLSEIIVQYPIFSLIFPCAIIIYCGILVFFNLTLWKERPKKFSKILNIVLCLILVLLVFLIIKGTEVMQAQLIDCKGFGESKL